MQGDAGFPLPAATREVERVGPREAEEDPKQRDVHQFFGHLDSQAIRLPRLVQDQHILLLTVTRPDLYELAPPGQVEVSDLHGRHGPGREAGLP